MRAGVSIALTDLKINRKIKLNKFIYILLFIFGGLLYSQERKSASDTVSTETIEVISNRIKTTKLSAPNKIQVLNNESIYKLNGNKLSDALSFSDGVFIKDYGFNSGLKTLSLNSTQSEHTIILLDGIKLNMNDNAQYDVSLLNLDDISRIEISKGGSSALYGSEAIGGVINVITKMPDKSVKPVINLIGEIGSYGKRKIYFGISQNIRNKFKYNVSYSNESSDNKYEYYFFNGFSEVLKQRLNSDYKNHSVNFGLDYKTSRTSELKLNTTYTYWNRSIPGVDLGTSPSTAKQIDRDLFSILSYSKKFSKYINLNTNVNYKYSLRSYYDTATYNQPTPINSFYKLNSYSNSSDVEYSLINFQLNFGYEVSHSSISSNETEHGKVFNGAVYTAAKYVISKFSFYPSVRYDYYSNINDKNVITGKLGVNIKPFKKVEFSIKSSIGNNFRAPTFNELYWKDLGNKNLKPERSISFDGGIYYKFKLLSENEFEVSYFNISTTDRIVWTPGADNLWRPINIGKVKSEGIDVSFNSALHINKRTDINIGLNYNYASALKKNSSSENDPTYNKQLTYIPKELVKSSFGVKYSTSSNVIKFVFLNAFYTFTGTRYNNLENTSFVPHYSLLDANICFELNAFNIVTDVKLAVNNITNENYQVISGYPMALRNFKLQVGFKY